MIRRRRSNPIVEFLRSPAVLPTTLGVTLFLRLFAARDLRADVWGRMNFFIETCFWLCVAIIAGLALHFGFDKLTDWLARPEEPHTGAAPPATFSRRQ